MKKMLLFIVLSITTYSWATDKYAVASGSWNATSTWSLTRGGASGAPVPGTGDNVIIPSPYAVVFDQSSKPCLNLTIENGGTLTQGASGNKLTPRYLNLYGSTLTVNGTFGEPDGCIGIKPYNASTTFTGTPTAFYFTRLQPQVSNLVLTFDCNCTITYGGSSRPLGGASGIYCNGNASTFTVNSGKTIYLDSASYIAVGTSGSNDPGTQANITLNVYGTLTQCAFANSNINLRNLAASSSVLHVYSTGILNVGNSLYAPAATLAAGVTVIVDNGGKVNFTNTGGVCDISKATTTMNGTWDYNNVSTTTRSLGATASVGGTIRSKDAVLSTVGSITLNAGSTVEYYGTSPVTGLTVSPVDNLVINNSAGVSLGGNVVVNNTLTLTNGTLSLGNNNLTVNGHIAGGSSSSYVITNGTGTLIQTVGNSKVLFPVGYGSSDYTPITFSNCYIPQYYYVRVMPLTPCIGTGGLGRQWFVKETTCYTTKMDTLILAWNDNPDVQGTLINSLLVDIVADTLGNVCSYDLLKKSQTVVNNTLDTVLFCYPFECIDVSGLYITVVQDNYLLPVELSAFTSKVVNRDVQLNWSTKTEKNSNKFEIERLTNLKWVNVGSVRASVLSNSPKQYSFTDKNLQTGKYQYRLKMIDNDGSFQYSKIVETEVALPKDFDLCQNYPNPFNPSTKITYSLPSDSRVILEVYNLNGEKIAKLVDEYQPGGFYSVNFVNKNISSGVYFYHLFAVDKATGNSFSSIRKMMLLK